MKKIAISMALTGGVILVSALPASAFTTLFTMADRVIKAETKKAIATPGHAQWCAKKYPGYRPHWNNYRIPNGRVKYCASPFFTPLWMRPVR